MNERTEEHSAALRRMAATLLALAVLAERVMSLPGAIRCLVLWILHPAQTVAWEYVWAATSRSDHRAVRRADGPEDAARLARRFRSLAAAFNRLACQGERFARLARACRYGCLRGADAKARRAADIIGWISTPAFASSLAITPIDTS